MNRPIRILGIDPGLRRTGWGMVAIAGNALSFLGCGSVTTNDRDALAARLLAIHDGLMRILDEFRPDEAAVEQTFVNKSGSATLKLGQARGIAMVVPARAGVPVAEYAPNLVKKSIVGAGHGDKAQVRMMIGVLLPKADPVDGRRRRRARHRGDACASPPERRSSCGAEGGGAMRDIHNDFPPSLAGEGREGARGRVACASAERLPSPASLRSRPPPQAGEERKTAR